MNYPLLYMGTILHLLNLEISHLLLEQKINLPLPSLEEQNEISEMFGSVDKKIMYTQKQLKETKKFKKSLLQQMFI